MDSKWKKWLITHRAALVSSIRLKEGLYTELIQREVIQQVQEDKWRDEKDGEFHQVEQLLNYMSTRPDRDFKQLCEALKTKNQGHVVTEYLTVEANPDTQEPGASSDDYFITLLKTWRMPLCQSIDLKNSELYSRLRASGVIERYHEEQWKEGNGTQKQAECLMDHMERASPEQFQNFCTALRKVGKGFLVDKYLT